MRFMVGFVLVLIGIVFVQSAPVVRQATDSPVDPEVLSANLVRFFTEMADFEMADLISPDQLDLFREDLFELMGNAADEKMSAEEIEAEFLIILQKHFSSDLRNRSDFQASVQKFVDTVLVVLPDLAKTTNSKRQATDDLDAMLATVPELSVLINPMNDALAQYARFLAPDQLKSLKEQAIQLILSLAAHNIDANQFTERLQALLKYYLSSNGKNDVDIDQLIQNVVGTNTEGLPNVILEILSQHQQ